MKEGFYYLKTDIMTRCYYISGIKKGNKWIEISWEGETLPNPEWWSLNWMNLPDKEEQTILTYHETNPTIYNLN